MDSFNPFEQSFDLQTGEGSNFTVTIPDLDDFVQRGIVASSIYSAQAGAALILLVVLLYTATLQKLKSVIYCLNALAVAITLIWSILQNCFFTGPWYEFYAVFAQDYSNVPASQYALSVTAQILSFVLFGLVETSLFLQIRAVATLVPKKYKLMFMGSAGFLAVLATIFRFAVVVVNTESILGEQDMQTYTWLVVAAYALGTASVCCFALIFVAKMGLALLHRHRLGIKQFGPLNIVFIAGTQCFIIPAIFSITEFASSVPALGSLALSTAALSLPMSAIWASAQHDPSQDREPNQPAGHAPARNDMQLKEFRTSGSTV